MAWMAIAYLAYLAIFVLGGLAWHSIENGSYGFVVIYVVAMVAVVMALHYEIEMEMEEEE